MTHSHASLCPARPRARGALARLAALCCALATAPFALGCSATSAAPDAASDAAADIATDRATVTPDVASSDVLVPCDAGAGPADLPQVRSTFVIQGDDGGSAPTPSGGDPVGTWRVEEVTMYLPPLARGQVDPGASRLTGTGWMRVDGTSYSLALDMLLQLETTSAGTVTRAIQNAAMGTYTLAGTGLLVAPSCGSAPAGADPQLGFSRDAPERGRLFVTLSTMGSSSLLVLSLARVP